MTGERSWIFLRGLVRGRGHWGDFPEKFRQRFPGDRVELLDLPGNGERSAELSPTKIADYVPLLRSRAEAIARGEKVHVLALSLGAMIAVEWMKTYPEDFKKLYLVCTSTARYAAFYQRFQMANYGRILPLFLPHSAARYEEVMMRLISNSPERQREVLPGLVQYTQAHPARAENFLRQLWAAARCRFPEKPPGEVEIIGSYGDHLVSPQCTLKLAQAWKISPRMHPWAGHDIPLDDPSWLLEQMI